MKCISAFLVSAAVMFGQSGVFTTGQAARLVIGQSTFTSQDSNSSDTIVGGVSGLAYAGDTLFVADANRVGANPSNHRVLLFQGLSSMLPSPTSEINYTRKCPVCLGAATVVLGQPNFTSTTENITATPNSLRLPTAVASDGVHVAVADTNHNRVLIWNRIPSVNNQAADVVVGQPNFTSVSVGGNTPTAKSMRGPQGVWIQNGKLYVADTQNNRVLIWNTIPTTNGVAADVVLGQPNFTTFVEPDLTQQSTSAAPNTLLNPVGVSSDGVHLFVTDLGYNRVLIWNSIPSANAAPADVALGQPSLTTSVPNYAFSVDPTDTTGKQTPVLCTVSNGNDTNGNPTYPASCNSTLNFPRFALAGSGRLFVADGGNDRVLVYNTIPTQSGAAADYVIGQIGGSVNQASDAADSLRTPMSLAWDGTNLYVSDAYNRRVTVYSVSPTVLPYQAVRNSASLDIVANGQVTIGGLINNGDIVTISIGTSTTATPASYTYTVKTSDTLDDVVKGLVAAINSSNSNAGDPNVIATASLATEQVALTARVAGDAGNGITLAATISTNAQILATASGANLAGGGDAAKIAPGTIVSIIAADGTTIAGQSANADLTQLQLPTQLGGAEVYFNGIRAPLVSVTPTVIKAQVPWEVNDTTSINAYVRSIMADGSIMSTTPVAVTIVPANPGVFAEDNTVSPAVAMAVHGSSKAIGIVDVEGSITANDVATVTVQDRSYSYTVQASDTLATIRDNLTALVNQDPVVSAEPSGEFTRIILKARVEGPAGNDIVYGASAGASATVIITAFSSALCCANVEGSPITVDNPAIPGEFIVVYATGLGVPVLDDNNASLIQTGVQFPVNGPVTVPTSASFVSSIAGGSTADVISATLLPGSVGIFKVILHLNQSIPTNLSTAITIAQDIYVSKVVTIPVVNPGTPQ